MQHALRAFTPKDQKAVKAAATTMRQNPAFDTTTAITELRTGEALVSFLDAKGIPGITERALIYPPASRMAQVTNGGSEANYITTWRLIEPGDEVVMLLPNYMQTWGVARAFGATIREWALVEDRQAGRWRVDLGALDGLVTPRTKLIVICNPNNPTGARLSSADLDGIARAADRVGAWVLSDEIYRGAELDGHESPTAWGRYDRVVVTAGLSKAYGLPGLRIGWAVGPPDAIAALWAVHDYTTIAPAALSAWPGTRIRECYILSARGRTA